MMEFYEKVGQRLRDVRLALGHCEEEVTKRIKMDIWRIESATVKVDFQTVSKLCSYYDIPIDLLAYGDERQFTTLIAALKNRGIDKSELKARLSKLKNFYLG